MTDNDRNQAESTDEFSVPSDSTSSASPPKRFRLPVSLGKLAYLSLPISVVVVTLSVVLPDTFEVSVLPLPSHSAVQGMLVIFALTLGILASFNLFYGILNSASIKRDQVEWGHKQMKAAAISLGSSLAHIILGFIYKVAL